MTLPGFMPATIAAVMIFGAGLPGTAAVQTTTSMPRRPPRMTSPRHAVPSRSSTKNGHCESAPAWHASIDAS